MSKGGHCRLRSWLEFHDYPPEPSSSQQLRVFEYGDALELLLFDSLQIASSHDEGGLKTIGGWWHSTAELKDPKSGLYFNPSATPFRDRQRHVEWAGHVGHIDALAEPVLFTTTESALQGSLGLPIESKTRKLVVVDAKSANRYSYERACFANLEAGLESKDAVFLREYAIQQNMLVYALKMAGEPVDGYMLVFINKEHGPMMFRYYDFNMALAGEGFERLGSAEKDGEPEPDWAWTKNDAIPLRCSYCEMKVSCAKVRGFNLAFSITRAGKPEWRAQ